MSICQHTHPHLRTLGAPRCCRLADGHDGPHDSGSHPFHERWMSLNACLRVIDGALMALDPDADA